MADPTGRASWVRRGRVSSRASSTRSSAIFEENHLHPGPYTSSSHSLRPTESRFSLNEQFAATRRDYEFGDDDASSILERATIASQDDTLLLDHAQQALSEPATAHHKRGVLFSTTHYELLCLPEDAELSPADIFRAYNRLFAILQPERQPQALVSVAQSLLKALQEAVQTLIEPHRRVTYDLSDRMSSTDSELPEPVQYESEDGAYEDRLREAYLSLVAGEVGSSTDLGIRLDASPASRRSQGTARRQLRAPSPVDLQLRQSMTLPLPGLGKQMQRLVTSAQDLVQSKFTDTKPRYGRIICETPSMTITGGVHGFLDEPYRLASVVTDRYHPPGPSIHAQRNLEQLIASRFLPTLSAKLRNEFAMRETTGRWDRILPTTVLETELAILPEPAITTRVAHAIILPDARHPLDIEVCVTKYGPASQSAPVVGLALHRRIAAGTGFLTVDAGDWTLRPAEECLHFSKFSALTKRLASTTRNPFRSAPTVEVGYTVGAYDSLGLRRGRGLTQHAEHRGIGAMDTNMDVDNNPSGSWTVSVGATAYTLAGYLRYGRDVFSSLSATPSVAMPPGNLVRRGKSGFRAEMEVGSSRPWLSMAHDDTNYLALRALKGVGRFSKFGFEVGMSPSNVHLSLYWSRLGHRISVPVLLATKSSVSTELVFWATVLPFLGFGIAEIFARQSGAAADSRRRESRVDRSSVANMQEYVARRRAEADELTVLLANGVEPRQRAERQAGGLVIISAKYNVPGAPSDEVADVTVAMAALVDGGKLLIPGGIRKSRLLGFWDPAPREGKVLSVRYLYRGREYAVEVGGTQDLRLPRIGEKST